MPHLEHTVLHTATVIYRSSVSRGSLGALQKNRQATRVRALITSEGRRGSACGHGVSRQRTRAQELAEPGRTVLHVPAAAAATSRWAFDVHHREEVLDDASRRVARWPSGGGLRTPLVLGLMYRL